MENDKTRYGMLCAIGAQVIWGLFPIYIDQLKSIDAVAIVAHRTVWSFVLLVGIFVFARFVNKPYLPSFDELRTGLRSRSILVACLIAALLIATNWIGFVWSATHDHKVDASLGYYICPQVVVLLGVLFLGERLKPNQWVAVGLAAIGVTYIVVNQAYARSGASMPSISLVIAFSFGFYALVKKRAKLSALSGLTFETGFLLIPAMLFLAYHCGYLGELSNNQISSELGSGISPTVPAVTLFANSWWLNGLLLGLGICTIAPLALYAIAVKHVPLSTIGFLQFIGPTIQFCIGVFLFDESFDRTRFIGFMIVWVGVGIYLYSLRKSSPSVTTKPGALS